MKENLNPENPLLTLNENLAKLIGELMFLLNRKTTGESLAYINEHGLTLTQLMTLHVLKDQGPLAVCDISQALKLSLPATSHLVDRLFKNKLVARSEDQEDRRRKRISITKRGNDLVEHLARSRIRDLSQASATLPDELASRFIEILELVVAQLRSEIKPSTSRYLKELEAMSKHSPSTPSSSR